MPELSAEGRRRLEEVANRHGVSLSTAEALLLALVAGGGSQAQFNIAELGGMGQWSRGGMVMVGDMFNNALKARVDALCGELSGLIGDGMAVAVLASQSQTQGASLFVAGSARSGGWWPTELGAPSSTGAQNDMRYAFFPASRRLAISVAGRVTVYDTADHQLGGFSQQQSGDQSLRLTSQHGQVKLSALSVVAPDAAEPLVGTPPAAGSPTDPDPRAAEPEAAATRASPADSYPPPPPAAVREAPAADDVLGKIERLADLHGRGILTKQEFEAKKAELLARL